MSFEDLLKDLQGQRTIQDDPNDISLDKLFNETFMSNNSGSKSFQEFLVKGNFQAETKEDIHNINDELFDRHVARETEFKDWKSMLDTATMEFNNKDQ